MIPRIGLFTPFKDGLGQWLVQFRAQFQPDTDATAEWAAREAKKAMVWAPARMVDQVEAMLSSWRNNDNSSKAGTAAFLPVLFAAVATDYTESPGEEGRPVTDMTPFAFPEDNRRRSFRLRMMSADLRVQLVVVASEALSAMSMMGQLAFWATERQRFKAIYPFAGFTSEWPVRILQSDRLAIPTPLGEQLSILSLDLIMRAAVPLFYGPRDDEANDGSSPDPGFAVVTQVTNQHNQTLGPPTGVSQEEWDAYAQLTAAHASRTSDVVLWPVKDGRR